ncbi:MAG: SDR family oxidoreductase [Candidatus Methylomirabilia bacterium]
MRALVIGLSGQVGGALAQALQARGHVVTGTYVTLPVAGAVRLDLADHVAVEELVGTVRPDWIFCPAGVTHVDWCEDHPDEAARVNVAGPLALARAAALRGAGCVYYSTEYVFDGGGGPYGENAQPRPLSVYGRTKLEGEQAILAESRRTIVIRTAMVYGPERQGKNSVYQLLRRCRAAEGVKVPLDQVSSPTYNEDLAMASVELAERDALGLFHVAGASVVDRYTFARLVCQVFDLDPSCLQPVSSASLNQRAPRPLRGGLRIDKARGLLATELRSAEAGLRTMRAALGLTPLGKLR